MHNKLCFLPFRGIWQKVPKEFLPTAKFLRFRGSESTADCGLSKNWKRANKNLFRHYLASLLAGVRRKCGCTREVQILCFELLSSHDPLLGTKHSAPASTFYLFGDSFENYVNKLSILSRKKSSEVELSTTIRDRVFELRLMLLFCVASRLHLLLPSGTRFIHLHCVQLLKQSLFPEKLPNSSFANFSQHHQLFTVIKLPDLPTNNICVTYTKRYLFCMLRCKNKSLFVGFTWFRIPHSRSGAAQIKIWTKEAKTGSYIMESVTFRVAKQTMKTRRGGPKLYLISTRNIINTQVERRQRSKNSVLFCYASDINGALRDDVLCCCAWRW